VNYGFNNGKESTLALLELGIFLVDDINLSLSPHNLAIR
jgi:hypothetical protein